MDVLKLSIIIWIVVLISNIGMGIQMQNYQQQGEIVTTVMTNQMDEYRRTVANLTEDDAFDYLNSEEDTSSWDRTEGILNVFGGTFTLTSLLSTFLAPFITLANTIGNFPGVSEVIKWAILTFGTILNLGYWYLWLKFLFGSNRITG